MDKSIGILDKDYTLWVKELVKRYRSSQIKAAVKVNNEMLRFYWELGKDIEEKQADNKYGSKFYATLSRDLRHELPNVEGLSETSIRYAKRFYSLYNQQITILPQLVEESKKANLPQLVERLQSDLFSVPSTERASLHRNKWLRIIDIRPRKENFHPLPQRQLRVDFQ